MRWTSGPPRAHTDLMTTMLRGLAALCLCVAVLIASGCGSGSAGTGANPASVAPEASFVYAEATIDPQGSQEQALRSILSDLPGTGAPQERLEDLLRKALESDKTSKLDWDKDVKPWLGDRVGGFVAGNAQGFTQGEIPAAAMIATTDDGAARDALEKATPAGAHKRYRDVEYLVEAENGEVT